MSAVDQLTALVAEVDQGRAGVAQALESAKWADIPRCREGLHAWGESTFRQAMLFLQLLASHPECVSDAQEGPF